MLGANVFGWTTSVEQSFNVLDAALDHGLNAIDTANVYSRWVPGHAGGESEAIIGVWLKERRNRDKLIIATKCGMDMGPGVSGLSKTAITKAIDQSLTRLQTDYIDLYQAHRDDPNTPLEETLQTFDELVRAGKVRAIGASNYSAKRLAEALRVSDQDGYARFESLQPLYNLVERPAYEADLQALCVQEDIGVINFYALASGFLTGKYRTSADLAGRARAGGVSKYLVESGLKVLAALDDVAARHAATPTEVALAWTLAQPGITAPIASATSPEQVAQLAKAGELTLPPEDLALINQASARAR
jgi:aryl-alcohol dehydrogenase-like predicted oxidoreductase